MTDYERTLGQDRFNPCPALRTRNGKRQEGKDNHGWDYRYEGLVGSTENLSQVANCWIPTMVCGIPKRLVSRRELPGNVRHTIILTNAEGVDEAGLEAALAGLRNTFEMRKIYRAPEK